MIGAKQIEILGPQQIAAGMATSDYSQDGGFGSSSNGINLLQTPGVVRSMVNETDISTNVAGNMIASSEDSQNVAAYDRLFVDDAANYYTLSSNVITKRHTGSATTHYKKGTTDMVSFVGSTFVTLDNDMALWNTSSLSLTESWWVASKSQTAFSSANRHPLLVFENLLWVADGNKLHTIDASLTIVTAVLTLNANELIVSLGIDPITGLMMIGVTTVQNYSGLLNARNILYIYDGYSTKPRRKIFVDDMITGFYNVAGQVYVGYGNRLGYWNGNGITFLRTLDSVAMTGTDLPYKHSFSNYGNTLLVINGASILAYGEVLQGGKKVFWYPYKQNNSTHLNHIGNFGSGKLAIAPISGSKLTYIDFTSTSAGIGSLYTGNFNFPRPIKLNMIRVITTGITTTAGIGSVTVFDEKGNTITSTVLSYVVTSGTKYVFDFQYGARLLQTLQGRLNFDTQGFGIVRVIAYFDPYE